MSKAIFRSKLFKSIASNKILPIVCVIVFITGFVLYVRWNKRKMLLSPELTDGIITKVYTARGMNGYGINYTITNDSMHNINGEGLIVCDKRRGSFLSCLLEGRKVPVIFEKNNPNNSMLLLATKDYEEFNIPISISLNRIVRYIDSVTNEEIFLKENNNPCNR